VILRSVAPGGARMYRFYKRSREFSLSTQAFC